MKSRVPTKNTPCPSIESAKRFIRGFDHKDAVVTAFRTAVINWETVTDSNRDSVLSVLSSLSP